jgi:hypothetical protein
MAIDHEGLGQGMSRLDLDEKPRRRAPKVWAGSGEVCAALDDGARIGLCECGAPWAAHRRVKAGEECSS